MMIENLEKLKRARRIHVLAKDRSRFLFWVKERGLPLQACNYLASGSDMLGISFSDPLVELVELVGWKWGHDQLYRDEAYRLRARYCLEKRVSTVPCDRT